MNRKAEQIIQNAVDQEPKIDCIGNFIFFSTETGEAWMLDHRDNRALRLAENSQPLPYKIIETKERFSVEWKERFQIQDELFLTTRKEHKSVFENYPTKTIQGLIDSLKEK